MDAAPPEDDPQRQPPNEQDEASPQPDPHYPAALRMRTPWPWRLGIALAVVSLIIVAYLTQPWIGGRGQAGFGVMCFFGIAAALSTNLRAVSWRTIACGFALQLLFGLFVMKLEINGYRPGYEMLKAAAEAIAQFLQFSNAGASFVFGKLADEKEMTPVFGPGSLVFAFTALPPIIFVSSFFTVLYYFGVLQFIVRWMARVMMWLMGTSGAETLSASANVFMGQTEAPLIVKPYVPRMTQSELLALMVGGMATISGGLMAVYIGAFKADAVAVLATSMMAAPCGLYMAKLLVPEQEEPDTRGAVKVATEKTHVNVIDAAASGAADGLKLALNVAAMLIAFLAFVAMFDYLLGMAHDQYDRFRSGSASEPRWSLSLIFGHLFGPLALLIGVEGSDIPRVGNLLGLKVVANEFVAYKTMSAQYLDVMTPRSHRLATYALTGFANFGSVAIQLGGIGAMAPSRRHDLARLGGRALLGGFLATLMNAAIAGILVAE
ncbi:MAG: NupC/NupG family nucleoside CNT transporter [Gemmataceae bacterium]